MYIFNILLWAIRRYMPYIIAWGKKNPRQKIIFISLSEKDKNRFFSLSYWWYLYCHYVLPQKKNKSMHIFKKKSSVGHIFFGYIFKKEWYAERNIVLLYLFIDKWLYDSEWRKLLLQFCWWWCCVFFCLNYNCRYSYQKYHT